MIDNTDLLHDLIVNKTIRLNHGAILNNTPENLSEYFSFDKIEGMLLGAAIGDSLGASTEGLSPTERKKRYGEIKDYLPCKRSGNKAVGTPTDDTQLTFWTLKQLIYDGGFVPDNIAKRFCKHHIIGMGRAVGAFIDNYKDGKKAWYEAGTDNLGNGTLMRISPIVVPYLRRASTSMYADAALDAMLSHNSFANTACCITWVRLLWDLLSMKSSPDPKWWSDTYCSIAEQLEGHTVLSFNSIRYADFHGSLWQFVDKAVNDALDANMPVAEACAGWGSGGRITQTVPSVLYILAKHAHAPEEAIIRAVNDTSDNDTIGSIVGAAVVRSIYVTSQDAQGLVSMTVVRYSN